MGAIWRNDLIFTGKEDEAREELNDLKKLPSQKLVDPAIVAMDYVGLGNTDNAFRRREKARVWGTPPTTSIKVDRV